jgi:antitoxin ParD1/3/4
VLEAGSGIGKTGGRPTAAASKTFIRAQLLWSPEVPMPKIAKITVALPTDTATAVRDAVASGDYATTSEVIREALRDWSLKRKLAHLEIDEMRRLVQEGAESGPGADADLIFARLRAKYAAMAGE